MAKDFIQRRLAAMLAAGAAVEHFELAERRNPNDSTSGRSAHMKARVRTPMYPRFSNGS